MSAEHDRDRTLDLALRRARDPGAPPPPGPACLDAETLAAWMDGGLDAGAVAMAEAHVSACARCQAMVGALGHATTPVTPATEPRRSLWRWWLAPIAAGAVAVTVWVVMPSAPAPALAPTVPMVRTVPGVPAQPQAPQQAARLLSRESQAAGPTPRAEAPKMADNTLRKDAALGAAASAESKLESRAEAADAQMAAAREAPAAAVAPVAPVAPEAPEAPIVIPSPDAAIRWRLAGDGAVDYTADSGRTWERLVTGMATELTAGASPSPTVVWIVGRGGVVLLATDGRTFLRMPFPGSADLVGVQATDARAATVTAADGRRFTTADGGQTWRQP